MSIIKSKRSIIIRDLRQKGKFLIDDYYLDEYARYLGIATTAVYVSLCRHADKEQKSFPSLRLLAEEHGISPKTVQRAIKKLRDYNIIHLERIRNQQGKWLNNTYFLQDKSVWKTTGHQKPISDQTTLSQRTLQTNGEKPEDISDQSDQTRGHQSPILDQTSLSQRTLQSTNKKPEDISTRGHQRPTKGTHNNNNIYNNTIPVVLSKHIGFTDNIGSIPVLSFNKDNTGLAIKKLPTISKDKNIKEDHSSKGKVIRDKNGKIIRRKSSYPKEWYDQVLEAYQEIKQVELHGPEFDYAMQAIKSMFMAEHRPEEIAACMRAFEADPAEWASTWTLDTIKKKMAEFKAGKLFGKANTSNPIIADPLASRLKQVYSAATDSEVRLKLLLSEKLSEKYPSSKYEREWQEFNQWLREEKEEKENHLIHPSLLTKERELLVQKLTCH